jgi:hypothetical protein
VLTHQKSRVESSQTHKDGAETVCFTYSCCARECIRTSRVESSTTSLAESRDVVPQVSLRQSESSDGRDAGADLDFVGPEACTMFGAIFKKKNTKLRI